MDGNFAPAVSITGVLHASEAEFTAAQAELENNEDKDA